MIEGVQKGELIPLMLRRPQMVNLTPEDRIAAAQEFERLKAQPVQCLSCGGKFVRAEDGSIPCGH